MIRDVEMLCPKCAMEMEHGYLQVGPSVNLGIYWFDRPFEHGEQFLAKKNRQAYLKKARIRLTNYFTQQAKQRLEARLLAM